MSNSTLARYNREVFVKLYQPHEGRNLDNDHTFSYFGIQLRYDRTNKRVRYTPRGGAAVRAS